MTDKINDDDDDDDETPSVRFSGGNLKKVWRLPLRISKDSLASDDPQHDDNYVR